MLAGFLDAAPAIEGDISPMELLLTRYQAPHRVHPVDHNSLPRAQLPIFSSTTQRLARLQQRNTPHIPNTAEHESAVH